MASREGERSEPKPGEAEKPLTPGQRLAAAKAAKAARKASKRGRQAQLVQNRVLERASRGMHWAHEHQRILIGATLAVLVCCAAAAAWIVYSKSRNQKAAAALDKAVESAVAPVREATDPMEPAPTGTTFASATQRAKTANALFKKVIPEGTASEASVWARLGEGATSLELERWEEARNAFKQALESGGDDPIVAWRALEGLGFAYEAESKWREAIEEYQQLRETDNGAFRDIADYHLGRMYLAQGNQAKAKQTWRALWDKLQEESQEAEEGDGRQALTFVRSQVEVRLAELDPSLRSRLSPSTSTFAPGAGGMSEEQIRRLIERLKSKGGGGAGAGAGGFPE